jgi:hypothetical protein
MNIAVNPLVNVSMKSIFLNIFKYYFVIYLKKYLGQ